MAKKKAKSDGFADLLPPLSTDEFAALKADIKANGVRDPVWVDEEGNILDGRHRLKINPKAPTRVADGLTEARKEAFVWRSNFATRNLSPAQKKECDKRRKVTAQRLDAQDGLTLRQISAEIGASTSTVSDWINASNSGSGKACDSRVKVRPDQKPVIATRVDNGETQDQVAADYGVSRQQISNIVVAEKAKAEKERERQKRIRALKTLKVDGFAHGDFRKVSESLPDDSVDLIFTDPPYDRKTLPLYGDLAKVASRALVDGGSLIVYFGQYQIHEVLNLVGPHMRLWWTLAVMHTGKSARMREYGVVVKWKPLLWFVKGTRGDKNTFVDDLVVSREEKDKHEWQQSLVEARYYIEKLTPKKGFVFDPFCGGGTTAVAAHAAGRKYLTCDVDGDALTIAKGRLTEK